MRRTKNRPGMEMEFLKYILFLLLVGLQFIGNVHSKPALAVLAEEIQVDTNKRNPDIYNEIVSVFNSPTPSAEPAFQKPELMPLYLRSQLNIPSSASSHSASPSPNRTEQVKTSNTTTTSVKQRVKRRIDSECVVARKVDHSNTDLGKPYPVAYLVCKKDKKCRARKKTYKFTIFKGYINGQQVWQRGVAKTYVVACSIRRKYRKS